MRPLSDTFVLFNEAYLFSEENQKRPRPIRTWDDMNAFLKQYFPYAELLQTREYWIYLTGDAQEYHVGESTIR